MKFSILKRVMSYCKPYNRFFIAAIVSAVIQISLTLYGPILVGQAVDYMIGYRNVDHIAILQTICILSATIVVSTVFQWIMAYCIHKLTYLTTQDMRVQTYQKLNTMPLKYLDGHAHGDIISRLVNDVDQVADGLLQGFTQFFTGIVTIVGTIIFMLTISPLITLVVVLITPLSIFVAAFIAKLSHKMSRQTAGNSRTAQRSCGEELVGNQKLVKTFHYEDRAFRDFREINEQLRIYGQKAQFYSALSNPSTRFVNNLSVCRRCSRGFRLLLSAGVPVSISIGGITSFLTYANQYTKPFNEVTGVITQIQTAFASAERLFEVLDETSEPADAPDAIAFSHCKGEVDISHLSFSYSPDTKLIEDFNLHVHPGDRVAIVGPTGCGKPPLSICSCGFVMQLQGRFPLTVFPQPP
ncbi:MAG: ABC transporter transmembrane domain-containing protein [Eubacteriales bacterium]